MMRRILVEVPLVVGLAVSSLCAQDTTQTVTPSVQQRVEVLLRSKIDFAPATTLSIREIGPSEVPGFKKLSVHFSSKLSDSGGDIPLLISKDGTHLAQFSTYDISGDPRLKVPSDGRPARGGPPDAPVQIVVFDDLECPFCARLNKKLYPALAGRYIKGQVRIVYQNVPISGHPWAMHAAIDTDCLAQASSDAYWSAVDAIHAHSSEYGGAEGNLTLANQQIDEETLTEGKKFHVQEDHLQACIKKQDPAPEHVSGAIGEKFAVTSTPTFFINGAKLEGDVPMDFVFDMIDNALRAQGQIPPPRSAPSSQEAPVAASR